MTAWRLMFTVATALAAGAVPAGAAGIQAVGLCLSTSDASAAVEAREAVAPGRALGAARRAVPGAAVLRAALCRDPEALVYRITVLGRDGRMMRVMVDGPSGTVKAVE